MSSNAVKRDWSWSDRFIPEIRRIVGPHLLEPSTLEVDRHEATDLVVLRGRDLRIACRVRRPIYGNAYASEFTVRSRRGSGAKTEWDKIVEGWGDWMLYAIASPDERTLATYHLIDLSALRAHLIRSRSVIRHGERINSDGTGFRWFDVRSFPDAPPLLIASQGLNERKAS